MLVQIHYAYRRSRFGDAQKPTRVRWNHSSRAISVFEEVENTAENSKFSENWQKTSWNYIDRFTAVSSFLEITDEILVKE